MVDCPGGFQGTITLYCNGGDNIVNVVHGQCRAVCSAGSIQINDAEVLYVDFVQDETVTLSCPYPYLGTVTLFCTSEVNVEHISGHCFSEDNGDIIIANENGASKNESHSPDHTNFGFWLRLR
eukprot:UN34437